MACHDLRTPLATVRGFAKTLQRTAPEEGPEARYLELIDAASAEMTQLLDLLGLVARVEAGRHELTPVDVHTGALAQSVAAAVDGAKIAVGGSGAETQLDAPIVSAALAAYLRCALRHGALERVELHVDGTRFSVRPVDETLGAILVGEDMKDLGAAGATTVLRRLGGTVEVAGGALEIAPPAAS